MKSSVLPARLQFQCGHAALVTLPRVKGETATQRTDRVAREKVAALLRQCDFCAPSVAVLESQHVAVAAAIESEAPATLSELIETQLELADLAANILAEVASDVASEEVASVTSEIGVAGIVQPEEREELEQEVEVVAVEPKAPRTPRARRQRRTTTVARPAPVATRAQTVAPVSAAAPVASPRRYAVRIQAQLVIRASTIQDALRQAATMGATDVLAITRQD
jgi:hypothetical protein